MMYGKPMMAPAKKAAGKKATSFKTCPGCPSPATCKAKGQCAKQAMKSKK